MMGRIPCKENLLRRNVIKQQSEAMCSLCGATMENENHLLLWCEFSTKIWNKNYAWWGFTHVMPRTYKEAHLQHAWVGRNQKGWQVVWFATIWAIWLARNRKTFQAKQVSIDEVFEMIQCNSYCWIKNKIDGWSYAYSDWCGNPSSCKGIKFQHQ
ncbi:hypothetical protein SLA2020_188570 [Shorea laevis]